MATMVTWGTGLVASMCLLHQRALLLRNLECLFRFLSKLAVEPVHREARAGLAVLAIAALITSFD